MKVAFKIEYSLYRKNLRSSYSVGLESFRSEINSNKFLKEIYLNRDYSLPTSIKIWAYKNL